MPKLTYWIATQESDSPCYNIVSKTKKECLAKMKDFDAFVWEGPFKSTIVYADAFDLFAWVTSEAGGRRQYKEGA